eukprot:TRINITY_DN8987_c0_g1_i1.p1 TRINITY_DN8987_c0_g1~~TRINITY_DN8987_c0_g1_i1.p1  ORF type:complete len:236 (+),score=74.91 TRINITY_DN8987_c0_g1_i1:51-710(+)
MEVKELLYSGAEARVHKGLFYGKEAVIKERFKKDYRLAVLDAQLRKRRMVAEAKSLVRCRRLGIRAPAVYYCDLADMTLVMECVQGVTVREYLEKSAGSGSVEAADSKRVFAQKIGQALAMMHNGEIVHGDLTTSNLLITSDGEICLIDFGLSQTSNFVEDYAVDLYVMERAVQSTHANEDAFTNTILEAYKQKAYKGAGTMERLEKVRARGRKRSMVG